MKFSTKTRDLVLSRAQDKCERCGGRITQAQIHHRKPRGMGGSKNPEVGSPANAMLVHPACHAWIESHREQAYENGWLVHSWQEPSKIPVKRGFDWVTLRDDGSVELGE